MSDKIRLKVENVSKTFGGVQAVRGVSIEAHKKQVLSIIGPNGAGKTSLINLISGAFKPDGGRVLLDNQDITTFSAFKVAHAGIARTFQNVALFHGMTALQNIMVGSNAQFKSNLLQCGMYWGKAQREEIAMRREVEEIIDFLAISSIRNAPVGELPLGLQKRVELARALAAKPKVLLLDEPMGGMNVEEKESMARYVLDVVEATDTAVVLIEHDMGVVMDISNHIVVLEQGQVIAEGSPEHVKSSPRVIEAYLGKSDAA